MKKSHIGLLPTFGDTYGFSVLEMQACGCPVITSNIFALPEINNSEVGWVIDLDKYQDQFKKPQIEQKYVNDIENALIDGMYKIIHEIVIKDTAEELYEKALGSVKNIVSYHDPIEYRKKLVEIYEKGFEIQKA